jgi:hypothetical protein
MVALAGACSTPWVASAQIANANANVNVNANAANGSTSLSPRAKCEARVQDLIVKEATSQTKRCASLQKELDKIEWKFAKEAVNESSCRWDADSMNSGNSNAGSSKSPDAVIARFAEHVDRVCTESKSEARLKRAFERCKDLSDEGPGLCGGPSIAPNDDPMGGNGPNGIVNGGANINKPWSNLGPNGNGSGNGNGGIIDPAPPAKPAPTKKPAPTAKPTATPKVKLPAKNVA